ncbi:hypothetical protein BsIDN1_20750 [Bacillus safensis]|uniref:Carbamoyl-phosphate synthetase large subunit oligomerisation domain-containing protein n=1 Tax=Bacillus safensis TaxID=561879 RepID=A0A5S9M4N0_BACIA|nr:hypothetical protein BsIDN1_20750 [Bacillus safensis]
MELLSRQETVETIHQTTKIDRFFLHVFQNMITLEQELKDHKGTLSKDTLKKVKEKGFLDETIALLTGHTEESIRQLRQEYGIAASFKIVDTCAAEFDAKTNYFYSTYFGKKAMVNIRKNKAACTHHWLWSDSNRAGGRV